MNNRASTTLLSTAAVLAATLIAAPAQASPAPTGVSIAAVQGAGFTSPLVGRSVSGVPGIVTTVRTTSPRGFWMQSAVPDRDRSTSDGIFVFTGSTAPTVTPGDAVTVAATVTEYRAVGSGETAANTANLSVTELTKPIVTVTSSGNPLPAPVTISPSSVPARFAPPVSGDVEQIARAIPARSAQEFLEAHEGERVSVPSPRIIAPSNSFGDIYITSKPQADRSIHGGAVLSSYNLPTGRIKVSALDGSKPVMNTGDRFAGPVVGPLDWSNFGGYVIDAPTLPAVVSSGLTPTVAAKASDAELSVATYNVENLAPGDSAGKYAALARGIVTNLSSPDVVAVEEVQDNSGAADDGTVAADATVARLTAAVSAAGGPRYDHRGIDPANDTDGGQPGGNIRTVFLFNPSRVSFVDRGAPSSSAATVAQRGPAGQVQLSVSPGRIAPADPAWTNSRKPLAGEFTFRGHTVFVVGNHFNSKGGDQSADGRFQPPARSSETQRTAQATVENAWVRSLQTIDPRAAIVVAGDLNDYQFSPAVRTLTGNGSGLTDLIATLPRAQQYTYVYSGVSQVLDHILVSRSLRPRARYEVVHLNAEFAGQTSDHDPQVVRVRP
ncbi:endonuclease/exonuclease/phosphatase family protein [Williamsia sp.]|uniref:endonuclease/exonuclease/phosphatase family protein n=1 Tax=Williamsia sp. TaxID=1872085 RepID=UPI001A277CE1|nr:endonuclease/exonuclease/phosphatase family protein [Williamsia sp.]MBJ7288242.1 endonuclease/exonuclease/phosphatase family protein [Williamsia sp.]